MNLTDIQIFMKVIKDMWTEIDRYASPKHEIMGLGRLSLEDEKIGVCRNFADHITAQLNAINPDYNARNLVVYMSGGYSIANIERNILENNETVEDDKEENDNEFNLDITKIFGNHMVTAVDIPNENITLVIDATNPSIGVFKDGRIYMFLSPNGNGLETKGWGQIITGGINSVLDIDSTKLKSFLTAKYSLEELEKKWNRCAKCVFSKCSRFRR